MSGSLGHASKLLPAREIIAMGNVRAWTKRERERERDSASEWHRSKPLRFLLTLNRTHTLAQEQTRKQWVIWITAVAATAPSPLYHELSAHNYICIFWNTSMCAFIENGGGVYFVTTWNYYILALFDLFFYPVCMRLMRGVVYDLILYWKMTIDGGHLPVCVTVWVRVAVCVCQAILFILLHLHRGVM